MRTFLISMEDDSEHIVQHTAPKLAQDYVGERLGMAVLGCQEIKDCKKHRIWGTVRDAAQDEDEDTSVLHKEPLPSVEDLDLSWSELLDAACSKLADLRK